MTRHTPLRTSLALLLAMASPILAGAPRTGLDLASMDRTVRPGDDFYAYANGAWVKATAIPADRGSFGIGDEAADRTRTRTADLIQGLQDARPGTSARKIADYYASFLDQGTLDTLGLKPLQPTLDRVAAIRDARTLGSYLGDTLRADVDVLNATNLTTDNLLGLWVAQDLNDPKRYVPFLLQGGLGLPDRQFYVDPAPRMADIRDQYRAHIVRVLNLAGIPDGEAKAGRILDLERRIAEVHWTREDMGDLAKGNNPWKRADFDTRAPGMDWSAFFEAAGLGRQQDFAVWQPSAITGISALARSVELETWKEYLAFRALEHAPACLPRAFDDERFAFFGRTLQGVPQARPRATRAVDATSRALGDAVGQLYVQRHFPASEKARAQAMVKNILAAFGKRIDQLPWMSPTTKAKAKVKLAAMKVGVGYPDRWTDYSTLRIVKGDAFGNAQRVERFELRRALAKLGRPVDRSEWVMTPQTVNAVNLPAMNAMNFPAAILQPPYFDPRRPVSMDYGAIGATIGHEISHSFDDSGALFDEQGRLKNWWTPEDMKHFQAAAGQLVQQFSAYKPFPDLAINGQQTLGENIADVAGLAASYDAYRLSLKGRKAPLVQGFTGDQQFFLSYAQSWKEKTREGVMRQIILTDGHTPAEYRPTTVRNLDAWYEAFDVRPGQAMHLDPKDRVRIW